MKERIKEFIGCTGNSHPSIDDITKEYVFDKINQLKNFIQEEVNELRDAVDTCDLVEALDATVDIEYFQKQIVILLEHLGIDYLSACNDVCTNNSLKYTTSYGLVSYWNGEHDFAYEVSPAEYDGTLYWTIKNSNGKVMKFKNFPKVDLKIHVPEKWRNW